VEVVGRASFCSAARRLGMPVIQSAAKIKQLEAKWGVASFTAPLETELTAAGRTLSIASMHGIGAGPGRQGYCTTKQLVGACSGLPHPRISSTGFKSQWVASFLAAYQQRPHEVVCWLMRRDDRWVRN